MALKWTWRNSHLDEQRGTARLGNLILNVQDTDGENQSYWIDLETKAKNILGKTRQEVFDCDVHFSGLKAAKERVEYIARCLYYGLPINRNEWEIKQKARLNILPGVQQSIATTKIRDIFIRGIYHLPESDVYLRVEYISNIDKLESKTGVVPMGLPSVVLKDVLTDRIFTLTLPEFKTRGFVVYDNVSDEMPEVIR